MVKQEKSFSLLQNYVHKYAKGFFPCRQTCKKASFNTRFDMSFRRPKATVKVQEASIISPLQNQYVKSGLLKVFLFLVKIRKTCTPLVIFRPFSLLRGARFANSVSNLLLVSLKKSRICRGILHDRGFDIKRTNLFTARQ